MRILVYGDIHLSSRNRARHKSYPDESLYYFKFITEQLKELKADCIVGLGDLSYGNFNNLKFREIFEEQLDEQLKLTEGERYELRGNHDIQGSGYSEFDFYVSRGKIKQSKLLSGSCVDVHLWEYGDPAKYSADGGEVLAVNKEKKNVLLCHDFLRFRDSKITGYGDAYIIEELTGLKGVEWIICGHIHDMLSDRGMIKGGTDANLFYPGAMCRPVTKGDVMEKAALLVIDTEKTENYVEIYEIELLPVEVSFDLQRVERSKAAQIRKHELSLATGELRDAVRNISPDGSRRTAYDIISNNKQVSIEVRDKALEYLKAAGQQE